MKTIRGFIHRVVLLLKKILDRPEVHLAILDNQTLKEITMPITLTTSQQVKLTVVAKDAAGNFTSVPAAPVWTSNDPAVKVVPAGEFSALVLAVGQVGSATVTVTAGSLSKAVLVQVVAGEAATLEIVAGEPETIVP